MKPNIIVFMTDHQMGDTILNNSKVKTPNVDRLRKMAVNFEDAYCPSPHCCPSRATFFSGLYPSEHGVWNNVEVSNTLSRGLFDHVRLFSEDLKEAGYRMYYSGKWHVSAEQGPEAFGFKVIEKSNETYRTYSHIPDMEEWKVYTEGRRPIDTGKEARTEGQIVREGYCGYKLYGLNESPFGDLEKVEAAVEKLENIQEDDPFFLYVGTIGPHDPYVVPQKYLDLYDPKDIELPANYEDDMDDKPALYRRTQDKYAQLSIEEQREGVRRFYAFCSYEDYLFGKILDKVEEKGILENTLILYVSDHGDYIGAHKLWAKGLPCFREAYHICSMMGGGPIQKPGRINKNLVSLADWAPTFLELAGVPLTRKMTGKSLVPYLLAKEPKEWRTELYSQTNGNEIYGIQRALWNQKWKYVFNTFDYDELYDLEKDPGELHNLLHGIRDVNQSKYGELIREFWQKLWQFAYENKDNCVNPYIMTAFAPYGPGIIFKEQR